MVKMFSLCGKTFVKVGKKEIGFDDLRSAWAFVLGMKHDNDATLDALLSAGFELAADTVWVKWTGYNK